MANDFEEVVDAQYAELLEETKLLRIWKADALERMADDQREYDDLEALLKEQNEALAKCSDALHVANLAITRYVEIKSEVLGKKSNKRKIRIAKVKKAHA